ncbi:MAG TPA: dihydroneopterin aldolase [Bacteroidia bacterium]|nr:dihydroneopterin aldolase [Bacteroidia bacterium]
MHKIHLNNIQLYAYHGCLQEEAMIGSNYSVDVILETDFTEAAKTDDLNKTIDYCIVFNIVKEEMAIRANLLENVAARIIKRLKGELNHLQKVVLTVTKLNPPMNGNVNAVSIIMEA